MFIRAGGVGLALSPRAASSSITNALRQPWSEVDVDYFLTMPTRVMFMREPHERAVSAYKLFKPGYSFESWLSGIYQCANPHLMQQTDICLPGKPQRIIRWNFDELSNLLGLPIPHDNASDGSVVTWNDETLELFDHHFAKDLELWSSSC
jgi:hypothetical protein